MHIGKTSERELGSLYQHIVLLVRAGTKSRTGSEIEEIGKEKNLTAIGLQKRIRKKKTVNTKDFLTL